MKNTIKMSLAAAVAVSALTTSATAGNLEEMIKGVEVSGYVDYRLENKSSEDKTVLGSNASENWNEYSVNVTATSKVNDIVSATVSVGFDEVTTANTANGTNNVMNPTAALDAVPATGVDQAYFTFDLGATTVMAGKQNIPSVFVDQADTIKQGAGIVALHKVNDALTLAGAHFLNNNIAADTKTSELIAMGKVGMVNYAVNYNYTDVSGAIEADRYSIALGTKIEGISLDVRHSAVSTDGVVPGTLFDDQEVTKFNVGAKLGSVKLAAMYAMTNDQKGLAGATATDVAIDADNDSKVHAKVWQLSTKGLNDGDLYAITAGMPLMDKVSASLTYAAANDGVNGTDRDQEEILVKLTYKMSKNFTIHGRYSVLDQETTTAGVKTQDKTTDYSRVQVKYTF